MNIADMPFQLDRSRNATVQVFEHLRRLIVSLALKPGSVLARQQLCDYYGLSLTPVREALVRLDEEHLVEIYPQHQTRVRCIDLEQARQSHFFRLSVELEIARVLASKANPALASILDESVERQRICLQAGNLALFTQLHMDFQYRQYKAAGVPKLWSMMRSQSGNLDRLRSLHIPADLTAKSILEQHADMAHRIRRGDVEAAQRIVRSHLNGTANLIAALTERFPGLQLPIDYEPRFTAI